MENKKKTLLLTILFSLVLGICLSILLYFVIPIISGGDHSLSVTSLALVSVMSVILFFSILQTIINKQTPIFKPKLSEIIPGLFVPSPSGNGEHGTSWWGDEKLKNKTFQEQTYHFNADWALQMKKRRKRQNEKLLAGEEVEKEEPIITDLQSNSGFVLGLKSEKEGEEKAYVCQKDYHSLTIGSTRSGKTTHVVYQSIAFSALAGESIVVNDTKLELYYNSKRLLEDLGYKIYVIDFKHPTKSDRYNILQPVIDAVNEGDLFKASILSRDIANLLVPDGSHKEKIWENGEKSDIVGAILAAVIEGKGNVESQTIANAYWLLARLADAEQYNFFKNYLKRLPTNSPIRSAFTLSKIAPKQMKLSFDGSALSTLEILASDGIEEVLRKSDFSFEELGKEKIAVFFSKPDDRTTFNRVLSLFIFISYSELSKLADKHGGRLPRNVNYILDEFGILPKINDFETIMSVCAGKGIRFNLFIQSESQLKEKYSDAAETIKNNCYNYIYLNSTDDAQKKIICDALKTYTTHTYGTNEKNQTSSSFMGRQLIFENELDRITRPYHIVINNEGKFIMQSPFITDWHINDILGIPYGQFKVAKINETMEKMRKEREKPKKHSYEIFEDFFEKIQKNTKKQEKKYYENQENDYA